jgi:hypothetical protein
MPVNADGSQTGPSEPWPINVPMDSVPPKRIGWRLTILCRNCYIVEALHVQSAIAVVARVGLQSRSRRGIKTKVSPFPDRRTHNVSRSAEFVRAGTAWNLRVARSTAPTLGDDRAVDL